MPCDFPILPGLLATPARFVWHASSRSAILADVHLGLHTSLAEAGLFLPDTALGALRRAWDHLVSCDPARLIIAGDLFDCPTPDAGAVDLCRDLFSRLPPDCAVTLTPGNHDPVELPPLSPSGHFDISPTATLDSFVISHGHELPGDLRPGQTWIVGHQHPAVTLATRVQSAKMPCYAFCEPVGRGTPGIVILPAFSHGPLGSNLLTARHWLLPVPRPGNERIRIAGLVEREPPEESQVLDFGPLSMLA